MAWLQGAVVHALQRAIDSGERHDAMLALRGLDPVLGFRARARLHASLRFAELNTSSDEPVHVFRVAGLRAAGVLPEDGYEDAAAVAGEFDALLKRHADPPRGPWLLGGIAAAGGLLAAVLLVVSWFTAPFDPREHPLGALLGPELTDFMVEGSRGSEAAQATRLSQFEARAQGVLPAEGVAALQQLLGAAQAINAHSRAGQLDAVEEAKNQLMLGAVAFDNELARHGSPFFVDVDWFARRNKTTPYVLSFYIERERRMSAADAEIRVIHLWRLDNLALRQGYLGYTRPHTPAALVLLDQVEEDLIGDVLPALPEGETMELVDFATRLKGEPWIAEVEAVAASAVRRHFAALPEAQQGRIRGVGALLSERRSLVRKWQATMSELGAALVVPRRLIPEADYLGELELKVPRAQLRAWESLHDQLLQDEITGAFVELRDNYVAAVERHEVQHRIDYRRELFEVPKVLVERLAIDNPLAAVPGSLHARARDELSAYLASVATAQPTPLLELALLCRFLFNKHSTGGPYAYAALGVYDALAHELSLDVAARRRKVLRRPHLAELVGAVLDHDGDRLRAAALAAYEKQYGTPVVDVQTVGVVDNEPWRH